MSSDAEITESLACFDFDSPPLGDDVGVFTCRRVWDDGHPVKYVSHDWDGRFQFICGGDEHTDASACLLIHVSHILERGPDQLRDFTYLRKGYSARHVDGKTWELSAVPLEEY